jgi:hypothetical protein
MVKVFEVEELCGLMVSLQGIPEHRKNLLNIDHQLVDIIAISILGIIAGAEGPSDIYDWADIHQERLIGIFQLEHGIPSRDTIRRALEAIQPVPPAQQFVRFKNVFSNGLTSFVRATSAITGRTHWTKNTSRSLCHKRNKTARRFAVQKKKKSISARCILHFQ